MPCSTADLSARPADLLPDSKESAGEGRVLSFRAEDLLQGRDTADILLGDNRYTLRKTRAGKLILTK